MKTVATILILTPTLIISLAGFAGLWVHFLPGWWTILKVPAFVLIALLEFVMAARLPRQGWDGAAAGHRADLIVGIYMLTIFPVKNGSAVALAAPWLYGLAGGSNLWGFLICAVVFVVICFYQFWSFDAVSRMRKKRADS